jgi:hypothetical protein
MKWIDKLFYKRLIDRITVNVYNDAQSLSIFGKIADDELEFIINLYQTGFDSGYNKGMEEGGDILKSLN